MTRSVRSHGPRTRQLELGGAGRCRLRSLDGLRPWAVLLGCGMPGMAPAERLRRVLLRAPFGVAIFGVAVFGLGGCNGWPDGHDVGDGAVPPSASAQPPPPPLDPMRAALQDEVLALQDE